MTAFFVHNPSGPETKHSVVGHGVFLPDCLSGVLDLAFDTVSPVHPGAGAFALKGRDVLRAAARRAGVPILPGTSIKGAVRTVFELITASCVLSDRKARCDLKKTGLCAACGLFGALGYAGRLGFSDGVPCDPPGVSVSTERVGVPYPPGGARRGSAEGQSSIVTAYKFYGRPDADREDVILVEAYRGSFRGKARFRNVTSAELGLVLFALGLGDGEFAFPLVLGGGRPAGLGTLRCRVMQGMLLEHAKGHIGRRRPLRPAEELDWMRSGSSSLDDAKRDALLDLARGLREREASP